MDNPLRIYIDLDKQSNILERKDKGIYQLKNRTGEFTVSVEEYENKRKDLEQKKGINYEDEVTNLKDDFSDVVWMYLISEESLPQNVTENSFNEAKGVGTNIEWNANIRDLEVGGGFVYIQPFRKGEIPQINLNYGAIFFSYGTPEIKGALWYEDKEGKTVIPNDKVIAYGSTVYLLVYTKDLYGQMLNIQFKDDDSVFGENEENNGDDDLGAYPDSTLRNTYKPKDNIPANIKKGTQLSRQVKTYELQQMPTNSISDDLVVDDINKNDNRLDNNRKHTQGAFFPVYIDPFWSAEANDFLEGSEIEIFPTTSNRHIKSTTVLKNATLKVSSDGETVNPNLDRSNMPVLVGETEANYTNFYHCGYKIIKGSYAKLDEREENEPVEVVIFDANGIDAHRTDLYLSVIAGNRQGRRNVKITTDANTAECLYENNKTLNHTHRVFDLSHIQDAIVVEENTRVNEHLIFSRNNFKVGNISFNKEEEGHKDTNDDNEINASHSTKKGGISGPVGISTSSKTTTFKDQRTIGRYPNSDTEIVLDIGYNYHGSLVKYIWPTRQAIMQNYPILLHTCAYPQKTLNIQVYPDIKWILQFAYDCDPEEFNQMRGDAYDKYLVKIEKLDGKYKPETIDEKISKIDIDIENAKTNRREAEGNKKAKAEKLVSKLEEKKKKQIAKKKKYSKKSKKAKKNYKSNRPDLFNFKDNIESGLSDLVLSLNVEYDRPGEALEISAKYQRYVNLVKQIIEVKNTVELILDGKKKSKKKLEKKYREIDEDDAAEKMDALKDALKGRPLMSVDIIPPSLAILGSWYAENPKDINTNQVGVVGEIEVMAKPFIGAEVTMDFLALAQKAHPIARGIITMVDIGAAIGVAPDIRIDFIASGQLEVEGKIMFNTASKTTNFNQNSLSKDSEDDSPLTVSGVFGFKLSASFKFSKKYSSVFLGTVKGYVEASLEVSTGFTLSGAIKADEDGIFIDPLLTFHGIKVKATIAAGYVAENSDGGEFSSGETSREMEMVLMHEYEGSFEDSNGQKIDLRIT